MTSRGSFGSYEPSGGGYGSYQSSARDSDSEFGRLSETIGNNIQKINQNVAQIQRMVSQIGTSQDTPEMRDKLHQIQHYSNQLAKDTNKYLKELSHLSAPSLQSDQRQRKMQKERLMNQFTTGLNNFQAAQRQAAEREKESVARARTHSGLDYDPFADESKNEEQLVGIESAPKQQSQVVAMEEDVDLQMIQEREQAIRQLESDITDVNHIFKDLGMLVHEQGEVVDSIEANVDSTAIHVEQGTEQLRQARDYQSKARKKKCIIVIVCVVVLAIIGLIIGLTVPKN